MLFYKYIMNVNLGGFMKKLLSLIMVAALSLTLFACAAPKPAATAAAEPATEAQQSAATNKPVVGLAVSTLNNPFFVSLVDGAKAKANELGFELIVVDAGDDPAKQTSDIEDLISKKVQVLIVNPVDSAAVAPVIGDVKKAGIKVISVDRGVDGETVDVAIASDNVYGGEIATKYLVELVGEGAKVAELVGTEGASAAIDRGKGFHNVADTKLNVVASQTANFNRADGLTVMENMLQANPDIVGVFAHNDEMALGALEAVGDKNIVIIGFDATDDALEAVKKGGNFKGTIQQQPALMGSTSVEYAQKLINGEKVDSVVGVEVTLVK